METSQIVFLITGIIFLLLTILSLVWVMWSLKNRCTENELRGYNWFKKWIYGNRSTFIILLTIILGVSGVAFIAIASGTPIV